MLVIHIYAPSPKVLATSTSRPVLPWDADGTIRDGTLGPVLKLDTIIESCVEGTTLAETTVQQTWGNFGVFFRPGDPAPGFAAENLPLWARSRDWSEHVSERAIGGVTDVMWTQTAVVYSGFRVKNRGAECHTDLRLLRMQHMLALHHQVGERALVIPLSDQPCTSGVFLDTATSAFKARVELRPTGHSQNRNINTNCVGDAPPQNAPLSLVS